METPAEEIPNSKPALSHNSLTGRGSRGCSVNPKGIDAIGFVYNSLAEGDSVLQLVADIVPRMKKPDKRADFTVVISRRRLGSQRHMK
jgi:hypothetical protein